MISPWQEELLYATGSPTRVRTLGARVITPDARGQRSAGASTEPIHEPATSETGHPSARSLTQLESSQTAMRDTTKWLVAAAAAVGAVVVAGLQLKNLPRGSLATLVALLGVAAALVAVAFILYRAAGVLAAGYTTFGSIVDLDADREYLRQQEKAEEWDNRLSRYRAMKRRPETPQGAPRQGPFEKAWQAIRRLYATAVILVMKAARRLTLRYAKDEDIRIDELIRYLNRDTFFFTQGLAVNITQLYQALVETDKEILSLRGERIGEEEEEEEEDANVEEGVEEVTPRRRWWTRRWGGQEDDHLGDLLLTHLPVRRQKQVL